MGTITYQVQQMDRLELDNKEWLVTNGIGGFACGTLSGTPTRKHHSLLTATLPTPFGRTIMLNYVADTLISPPAKEIPLSLLQRKGGQTAAGLPLVAFRLENGIPSWTYTWNGILLEKSLLMVHRQNTVHISYKLLSSQEPIQVKWRPFFHLRANDQAVNTDSASNKEYSVHLKEEHYEMAYAHFPLLRMHNTSSSVFTPDFHSYDDVFYSVEAENGYPSVGSLMSPGFFLLTLSPQEITTLIISTETWNKACALTPHEAQVAEKTRKRVLIKNGGLAAKFPLTAKLILAADQFLITPTTRFEDLIRLQASGEEAKSIIAGFPWFTDWGRDTMISLEGLTLTTGRTKEASSILSTFAHYIQHGLIPNMFPDGENLGVYNTADATLWFFHAIERYIAITQDEEILEFLLPKLHDIMRHHINGTRFGIGMDKDGLLKQGQEGVQLTWMDAKVGNWVVTPRRGKAVEINALWYNALKLFERWANKPADLSQQCYESFNRKFWFEKGGYLYDVIEGEAGDDSALRPNQLFAISLSHPVLKPERWKSVLENVERDLLTPVGLRTLSPSHPDYKSRYQGNLYARDAAYHQGTVWPWLLGAYIDVWLKVYPDAYQHAYEILQGLEEHLHAHCIGSISEIFDPSPPFQARGCFAQAWSVAELLRSLVKILPHCSHKESSELVGKQRIDFKGALPMR